MTPWGTRLGGENLGSGWAGFPAPVTANFGRVRAKGVAATRQLAKRQLTWLRAMPCLTVFDCLEHALDSNVADLVESKFKPDRH